MMDFKKFSANGMPLNYTTLPWSLLSPTINTINVATALIYDVKCELAQLSVRIWNVKFLQYIWKKLYYLVKVASEVTAQHNGGKTFKGSFGSDANKQITPEVRYL
jgi:hypothetical protein